MIQGPSGSDCIKSKLFAQGSSRSLLDLTVPPLPGPEFNRAKIRRGADPLHAPLRHSREPLPFNLSCYDRTAQTQDIPRLHNVCGVQAKQQKQAPPSP